MASEDEIRSKSLTGVRWTTAQTLFVALIGPFSQVAKARFLVPEALGAVAVFMIVLGLINTIGNAGVTQSLIQLREIDGSTRFSYLLVSIAVGLLGAFVLVISAVPIERALGVPGSALLIRLSAPLPLVTMVDQLLRAALHRNLHFKGPVVAAQP